MSAPAERARSMVRATATIAVAALIYEAAAREF